VAAIRAFIAIAPDRAVREALAHLRDQLRDGPGGGAGRWVRPESIHLTLKFLGDVPPERIPAIGHALETVCRGRSPFLLRLEGLGCFPNTRRPRVIWVGVREETGVLAALQRNLERDLERDLEALGHPRAFAPHLTLARVREGASLPAIQALGQQVVARQPTPNLASAEMLVREVILFRSDLLPQGPHYQALQRATLGG